MICGLTTGDMQTVILMPQRRPLHLAVSPGWGFIAVWSEVQGSPKLQWELKLFSVNGIEIGATSFDSDLAAWHVYVDHAGFDFIVLGLRSGDIYQFELYRLIPGARIARCKKIVAIAYVPELDAIAAVSQTGKIHFINRPVTPNVAPASSARAAVVEHPQVLGS
jgi:hypothetical protein